MDVLKIQGMRQPITDECMAELEKAFRPSQINPTTSMEQIMFEAGGERVLAWLRNRIDKYKAGTNDSTG